MQCVFFCNEFDLRAPRSIVCTSDSKKLIIGYADGHVSIIDIIEFKILETLEVFYYGTIVSIDISKDNKHICVLGKDYDIAVIRLQKESSNEYSWKTTIPEKIAFGLKKILCFTEDGENVIFNSNYSIIIFSLKSKKSRKVIDLECYFAGFCLSNNGKEILIAQKRQNLTKINLKSLEVKTYPKFLPNYRFIDAVGI